MIDFKFEHIPKDIRKYIGNKNIIRNIYRIQAYHSIICRYFFIGFIDFILKEYYKLFFPSEYEKNEKIVLKCFQYILKRQN